jgi:hypothetical protein
MAEHTVSSGQPYAAPDALVGAVKGTRRLTGIWPGEQGVPSGKGA